MNLAKYYELMEKDGNTVGPAEKEQLKNILLEVAQLFGEKTPESVLNRIYAEKLPAKNAIDLLRQNIIVEKERRRVAAEDAKTHNNPQAIENETEETTEEFDDEHDEGEENDGDGDEEDGGDDDSEEEQGEEEKPHQEKDSSKKKNKEQAAPQTDTPAPKKPKPIVASMLPNTRNRWIMVIGAILLVVVILILSNSSGISAQQSTALETRPDVATEQTIKPVDIAHADWTSPSQIYIIIMIVLLARYCYKDADDRGEIWDAIMSFACAGAIFFFGWVWNVGLGIVIQTKLGLNPEQLKYFGAMYGAIFVFLAFGLVISFSRQGIKVDWTPFADFLALVGSGGLLFGDLGCLQLLMGFQHSYVLNIFQAGPLVLVKDKSMVWMTVVTYGLLLASIYFYWKEVARFIKKAEDPFMATLKSFAGIPLYIGFRTVGVWASNKYFGSPLPAVFLFFIFLASIGVATSIGLELVKDDERAPTGKNESRLDKGFIIPYDRISLQLAIGILVITALGMV